MKAKLIFLLLSLTGIINVSSCRKEPINEMPPETQTGANTFGCLIDGELFVGGCCAPGMTPPLKAGYYTVSEKLYVVAWGKTGSIEMEIYHPTQTSIQTDVLIWYHPDPGYCWRYLASSNTEIFITKLDTISKIVSGRFQFVGYCGGDDSTNTKQITQGRFDIKLNEISNN